jgi:hypothetical protein
MDKGGTAMTSKAIEHLQESLELSGRMMDLAERGVEGCLDDGCLTVYGIMRDCAYQIQRSAEKELTEHMKKNPAAAAFEVQS